MVRRFYGPLCFEMKVGTRGDYVRYTDYASLEAENAELRAQLAESDKHSEKIEALLDPHVGWEGKPPKAYADILSRAESAERQLAEFKQEAMEVVGPFSEFAGELFARNYNDKDTVVEVKGRSTLGTVVEVSLQFIAFRRARSFLSRLQEDRTDG